jgi:hypothetical protein
MNNSQVELDLVQLRDHAHTFEQLWKTLGGDIVPSRDEAWKAVRKLQRHALGTPQWGTLTVDAGKAAVSDYSLGFDHETGTDYSLTIATKNGWASLVRWTAWYCVSVYNRQNNTVVPEWRMWAMAVRMTKEVIKRGWLAGDLVKPKAPPTKEQLLRARLKRIGVLQRGWERKQRRAINAIKKLERERARIEKRLP